MTVTATTAMTTTEYDGSSTVQVTSTTPYSCTITTTNGTPPSIYDTTDQQVPTGTGNDCLDRLRRGERTTTRFRFQSRMKNKKAGVLRTRRSREREREREGAKESRMASGIRGGQRDGTDRNQRSSLGSLVRHEQDSLSGQLRLEKDLKLTREQVPELSSHRGAVKLFSVCTVQ